MKPVNERPTKATISAIKAEEIRKKLEASIATEDYESAEKYKTELLQIKPRQQVDIAAVERAKKEQEEKGI